MKKENKRIEETNPNPSMYISEIISVCQSNGEVCLYIKKGGGEEMEVVFDNDELFNSLDAITYACFKAREEMNKICTSSLCDTISDFEKKNGVDRSKK